ncbi:hypothetical protein [uncultured Mediterranean phage uvMED]|nr:hypothetical protein [uncultured Mediterranean phage uvMED]
MEKTNRLIAEFMGLDTEVFKSGKVNYYYYDKVSKQEIFLEAHELSYDVSWDWLMPVVEKIVDEYYNTAFNELNNKVNVWTIEDTYNAVVEFIKDQNTIKNN